MRQVFANELVLKQPEIPFPCSTVVFFGTFSVRKIPHDFEFRRAFGSELHYGFPTGKKRHDNMNTIHGIRRRMDPGYQSQISPRALSRIYVLGRDFYFSIKKKNNYFNRMRVMKARLRAINPTAVQKLLRVAQIPSRDFNDVVR